MFENEARARFSSNAPTAMASGYAPGYTAAFPLAPLFPAAATTTEPLRSAYCIAIWMPGDAPPPRLRLMTRAPWSAAQTIPAATFDDTPLPFASSTRTGRMRTLGAAPAMPRPLFTRAAMIPATCVPCPSGS